MDSKNKLIRVVFRIVCALGLVLTSACVTLYNPATQRNEVYFIDQETEIAMGNNLAAKIIKENKLVVDEAVAGDVRRIGENLASVSDRPDISYHFYVIENKEMNAFALPGGHIFVHKGLIDKTDRQELAFVLAHEIGHISARHSLKRLQAALGVNLILNLALGSNNAQSMQRALGIVYNVVAKGYSRQDEYLADTLAVRYTDRGGFTPEAGISLMQKLEQEAGGDHPFVFLSSHPRTRDRIEHIRRAISKISHNY